MPCKGCQERREMFWHGVHRVQEFISGPKNANEISGVPASAPPEYRYREAPQVNPDTVKVDDGPGP